MSKTTKRTKKAITKFRSKLEALVNSKLGRGWKYEPFVLPYVVHRNYVPDFVKGNKLIEVKGYFRVGDTQKYKAIRDSLSSTQSLIFILADHRKKIRKGAKMNMGEWCDKEGFVWYDVKDLKKCTLN